jgi:RHS repeat-associated protein
VYGGLNGTGGFEAIIPGPELFCPTVCDARGNVLAVYDVTHASLAWNASRPTGYGAVPGYRPLPLGAGGSLIEASAWRGRWVDITGLVNLGARHYRPENGSFESFDPNWSGMDPNGFSFAGGEPINYFDADGRLASPVSQNSSGYPPLFALPAEPFNANWVVRAEYPGLVPDIMRSGYATSGVGSPAQVAFFQEGVVGRPYFPASTTLPYGAPGIQGQPLWINLNSSAANVEIITNPQIIADARRIGVPPALIEMYQANQLRGEGEILFRGNIGPSAISPTMPPSVQGGATMVLMRGTQGLTVIAAAGTGYRMGTSIDQSVQQGSFAPVAAQTIREVGGWGGAIAGAKLGGAVGTALGIETGPGAILTGLGGAIIGGTAGYFGADWVADRVHKNP